MRNFHGEHKRKSYFEGWYFKHQGGGRTISFIPAFHIDGEGVRSASLQVITDDGAFNVPFPPEAFSADKDRLAVKLGNNLFSENGVRLSIDTEELTVEGMISYGPLLPVHPDIMGPFRFVPAMQCVHGVTSMRHDLRGSLTVNGMIISFDGGTGYIESDRGSSFPQKYLWTQCNRFDSSDCAIFASCADIPPLHFDGCICDVIYGGKEYRLATYRGGHAEEYSEKRLSLRQGGYSLEAELLQDNPHPLRAPQHGGMTGTIHESAACTVRYTFRHGEDTVFDLTSGEASFEFVK